jgi:hypothetical protein
MTDDTYLSDSEVLRRLAEWLKSTYIAGAKLGGILYLRRITDARMQGSTLRNLKMFTQLCGEDFYKSITFGTTCWALFLSDIAEKRENELIQNTNFWKPMLDRGARLQRIPDDVEAARNLLVRITNHETVVPQVVEEMERGTSFADLASTKMLNYDLEQQREKQLLERSRLILEQEAAERQREAQRRAAAEAHELQVRRQFHVNLATRCKVLTPSGSCNRCGRDLYDSGPVYRTYSPVCLCFTHAKFRLLLLL